MKRYAFRFAIAVTAFLIGIAGTTIWLAQHRTAPEIISLPNTVEPIPQTPSPARSPAPAEFPLEAIDIINDAPEFAGFDRAFENLSGERINVSLELGDEIENQIIVLRPNANERREFRVEQQFQTSMTVMDEGPHLDLLDWKHYTSEWREVQRDGENRFVISEISGADEQRFPRVTREEIYRAVRRAGDRRWAALARQCAGPNAYPCGVSINRLSLRIMVRDGDQWRVIQQINFAIPMGC